MPPRFMYWTILIDGNATAFRAREKDELLPTFFQLKRKNADVVMKWFAHGKLWESPEAERAARQRPAFTEKRGADWRPGGAHKDPRDRFKKKPADRQTPRGGNDERPQKPWSAASPHRKGGSWGDKPRPPRKPWHDKPGASHKPWQGKPEGQRKPWQGRPDAPRKPWKPAPDGSQKPWHAPRPPRDRPKPWAAKPAADSRTPWRPTRQTSSSRWRSNPQGSGNPPHRDRKPWEGSRRPPGKRRDDDPDKK